jgi:C-terminal processing protease CtpA/Prc
MNPALGASTSLLLFEQEIQYFQASTDALVIDVMRNPGGLVSFVDELCRRLHPTTFRTMGFEVRATLSWLNSFAQSVVAAKQTGQPDWLIAALQARYDDILHNYLGNRGRSGPVPLTYHTLDLTPATDASGNVLAYTKPILVLVDEFSASGGDAFPAILQDNNRATIFGMRTMGAGGSVVNYPGANFTEGNTRVTVSLMNRNRDISTAEYPSAPYVENIGVRPDIVYDYMTRENLLTGAQPFVQAFTQAVLGLIR